MSSRQAAKPQSGGKPSTSKPENHVMDLQVPVDFAGMHYDKLTIRRLKAKDFRVVDSLNREGGGPNANAIAMSALVCNVDEGVIDELDAVDYIQLQEVIADFFPEALVDKLQGKAFG